MWANSVYIHPNSLARVQFSNISVFPLATGSFQSILTEYQTYGIYSPSNLIIYLVKDLFIF